MTGPARHARLPLVVVAALLAAAATAPSLARDPETLVFEMPLEDGELDVGDLLRELCDALGVEPAEELESLDWSIPVRGPLGRATVRAFNRLAGGVIELEAGPARVTVTVDRARLDEASGDVQRAVGTWLGRFTDEPPGGRLPYWGIILETPTGRARLVDAGTTPERVVLLVHGLDDPGWMWRDMIPALRAAGHEVARFEYPNDGPIADAADLLAVSLTDLKAAGTTRVDLVAHSMGGLVSRDLLTRPSYYDRNGAGTARLPAVDRLVMLGTPNHGSQMARLRFVSELNEQINRLLSDGGSALGSATDGNGEAAVDLLPGSVFLRRLNGRGPVRHTRHTIVAGRISPVGEEAIDGFIDRARRVARSEHAPRWLRSIAGTSAESDLASSLVTGAVRGLGDGVVTIDSARLEGVDDFTVVEANHLSMLVRLTGGGGTPPAIPIVLDRLAPDGG
ncbi:MAG: esterase/lipase family protein [Planctomycetota bacterium]